MIASRQVLFVKLYSFKKKLNKDKKANKVKNKR